MHPHIHEQAAGLWSWFSGGQQQYMKLSHCMNSDWFWIVLTVTLDVLVGVGYGIIAMHWWRNQRSLQPGPAKSALGSLRNIFIFCAFCGYIFIPMKMVWPAWRLYDIAMAVLVYFTWKYAWGARQLKVLYTELGKTEQLSTELQASREEARRKSFFLNAISHDLRTPLNGLTLQAHLAEINAENGDLESVRESLAEIKASAKATADLLSSFLELGRLDWVQDQNSPSTFNLRSLIEVVASAHQAAAGQKGLKIHISSPADAVIFTDRVKLERVLGNLVGNAVKFTERGEITVG
jgi:signal transduction histidine kinase